MAGCGIIPGKNALTRAVENTRDGSSLALLESAPLALVRRRHEDRKLDARERRAVATHPARGATVLAPIAHFHPRLAASVLAHHESWDGTGYPRRLRGNRIPFEARVVTIADTFDAITYRRRYR